MHSLIYNTEDKGRMSMLRPQYFPSPSSRKKPNSIKHMPNSASTNFKIPSSNMAMTNIQTLYHTEMKSDCCLCRSDRIIVQVDQDITCSKIHLIPASSFSQQYCGMRLIKPLAVLLFRHILVLL